MFFELPHSPSSVRDSVNTGRYAKPFYQSVPTCGTTRRRGTDVHCRHDFPRIALTAKLNEVQFRLPETLVVRLAEAREEIAASVHQIELRNAIRETVGRQTGQLGSFSHIRVGVATEA
jgi:hypothetical protein